ncbi:hypothetical protein [Sphingomonas sp. CFBP 13706]|uniref:hypothetical protein n=1 Tax=Sphingomonas sp. CFBP 13706 TaxID=2775314 RepID=UPI0017875454|nr:hypothetical protein [Sphingomonas sp. CFBP 13706]MBD8734800.1 hypothetical protein [Sphingomonas sp. CFBP 13706]
MMLLLIAAAVQAATPAKTVPGDTTKAPATLGPIGKQAMPARGCAAYLWSTGDRTLVAMATADSARLRLAVEGKPVDYARVDEAGPGGYGFAGVTTYRGGDLTVALDMTIVTREDLASGAMVPNATLRLERPGRDTIVLPVAGMIGCV